MPSKIETSLTPEQLHEFFKRCAQLRGSKLKDIQALAEEFGIDVSLMAARSFRKGAFADYLSELKAKREMAENVSEVAKSGLSLTDAAASVLAQKLFDRLLNSDELSDDESDQLSLALSRLRLGDQRSKLLDARLREIEQKLEMQQFDAAQAVLKHAKEIRSIMADTKANGAERAERVRRILFGEQPKDFAPVATKGEQAE